MWSRILNYAGKYGKKAIQWAIKNRTKLINIGLSALSLIKSIWG